MKFFFPYLKIEFLNGLIKMAINFAKKIQYQIFARNDGQTAVNSLLSDLEKSSMALYI